MANEPSGLGNIILRIYDRALAIHRKQTRKRVEAGSNRTDILRARLDHIDVVVNEKFPEWFPQYYHNGTR